LGQELWGNIEKNSKGGKRKGPFTKMGAKEATDAGAGIKLSMGLGGTVERPRKRRIDNSIILKGKRRGVFV